MDMSGEYRIAANREAVWDALNDPEVLKACIPGCEELDKTSDTEFTAKVTAKVGPVKAKFAGKVNLSNMDPPNGYTIAGEGQGGAAGFAKGGADVALAEDGGETVLSYKVNAQVGGKLAQIGSRLIDGTARKLADEFFSNFKNKLEPSEEAAETPAAAEGAMAAAQADAAGPSGGLSPIAWIAGVVALVIVLLLIFGM